MITVREYKSFKDSESIKEEWDRCVLDCNSPVYMTFDWCQIWWDFYGKNKDLSIYLFYNENELAGILPVYFEKIFLGPFEKIHLNLLPVKVCRLVGANIPPRIFDPPVKPDYRYSVFKLFLNKILQVCDVVSLGPVTRNYNSPEIFTELVKDSEIGKYYSERYDPYAFFELPDTFENYLESIDNAEKKNYKYNLRRLTRDFKINVEVNKIFDEKDFNNFQEMHYQQWIELGKLGHFKSWPLGREFNFTLAKKQAESGRYRLIKITKNDEAIVYVYGYKLENRFYGQLNARSTSPENQKFSLGTIGMITMAKTMIEENIKYVEGGLGHYDYKLKLGAKSDQSFIYRFVAKRKSSLIKNSLLALDKKAADLTYHKIWYRRIQPVMPPVLKKPISDLWIKREY